MRGKIVHPWYKRDASHARREIGWLAGVLAGGSMHSLAPSWTILSLCGSYMETSCHDNGSRVQESTHTGKKTVTLWAPPSAHYMVIGRSGHDQCRYTQLNDHEAVNTDVLGSCDQRTLHVDALMVFLKHWESRGSKDPPFILNVLHQR